MVTFDDDAMPPSALDPEDPEDPELPPEDEELPLPELDPPPLLPLFPPAFVSAGVVLEHAETKMAIVATHAAIDSRALRE